MADEFTVRGLERFAKLSKDLRAAGDKDLRRELYRGLQRATKPLKEAAKENARILPQSGGLADRVRRARYNTRSRAGKNPSVRVEAKDVKGRSVDLAALDRGVLRHPTFGHRPWKDQRVRPGWFTDAVDEQVPAIRIEVVKAIDAVIAQFNAKH